MKMPNKNTGASLKGADLLTLSTLDAAQIAALFKTASATKRDPGAFRQALAGKSVILLFEKPSLRTRVTFELGPNQMGGAALYFDHSKERIGQRESVRDYAKNLERWVQLIVARVYSHAVIEQLAEHSSAPVINALSDQFHPCQALADCLTLAEHLGGIDKLRGTKLAFVGDGNNVCHSLMHGAAILGANLTVITPPRYEPEPDIVAESRRLAEAGGGGSIELSNDAGAVKGSRAVYTDAWTSMGDESEAAQRRKAFSRYQVNAALMAKAGADAKFMHCLPAHRGEEVTDEVIDSPNSIVYDQAENRLHAQNALMLHVLGAQ
jgi:ornithine carbamoyltransferase